MNGDPVEMKRQELGKEKEVRGPLLSKNFPVCMYYAVLAISFRRTRRIFKGKTKERRSALRKDKRMRGDEGGWRFVGER